MHSRGATAKIGNAINARLDFLVNVALSSEPQKDSLSTPAKFAWAMLICLTLGVCYFSHLGAIGFVGPDEPRYAWIARAMAETGDWVTPKLYGKPWFEKPPLFYWGAALSFKLFGVSEAAARLPSAISALLATLAMGWLAWRMYGAEAARWLLLLLPTTVGMIGFSHAAATDMPFSAMLTIAMVCAAVVSGLVPKAANGAEAEGGARPAPTVGLSRGTPWLAFVLFGFFLGLAVLAKGPAAIVLCGGAVFFWALFTKRWRDAFRLLHPAAIAAFCVTALPWYILCARRNPDFLRIFIIEHNFKRYLTPEFQHIQPFWFYIPVVLLALFPSAIFVLPLASRSRSFWSITPTERSATLLFLAWAGFTIVFFSVSKSKLPGYILPAVPPLALVLAQQAARLPETSKQIRTWTGVLFAFSILAICAALFKVGAWNSAKFGANFEGRFDSLSGLPIWVFLAGGIWSVVLAFGGRSVRAVKIGILTIVLGLGTYNAGPLALDDLSAKQSILIYEGSFSKYPANEVATYKLRRAHLYCLNFYFHRELPEWSPGENEFNKVVTDFKNVADSRKQGLNCTTGAWGVLWTPVVVCTNPRAQ